MAWEIAAQDSESLVGDDRLLVIAINKRIILVIKELLSLGFKVTDQSLDKVFNDDDVEIFKVLIEQSTLVTKTFTSALCRRKQPKSLGFISIVECM